MSQPLSPSANNPQSHTGNDDYDSRHNGGQSRRSWYQRYQHALALMDGRDETPAHVQAVLDHLCRHPAMDATSDEAVPPSLASTALSQYSSLPSQCAALSSSAQRRAFDGSWGAWTQNPASRPVPAASQEDQSPAPAPAHLVSPPLDALLAKLHEAIENKHTCTKAAVSRDSEAKRVCAELMLVPMEETGTEKVRELALRLHCAIECFEHAALRVVNWTREVDRLMAEVLRASCISG